MIGERVADERISAGDGQRLIDYVNFIIERLEQPLLGKGGLDETPPASFALLQNYPNPFNPVTLVPYDLADAHRLCCGHQTRDQKGDDELILLNAAAPPRPCFARAEGSVFQFDISYLFTFIPAS